MVHRGQSRAPLGGLPIVAPFASLGLDRPVAGLRVVAALRCRALIVFFQKSLAKILFAINLQQYTLSRRSNSQDECIHQSSYKTTPRQAGRKQTVIFQLTNRNLRDIFYTLKDMFLVNFYSGFTKFGTLPIE